MQYQSMPMQPPPPAAGTMAQPPNSMVAPTGPQMAYGMPPPPGGATPSTTEATSAPSTTFNMASMGATLPHPGGQQPPVYQTAPQGIHHGKFDTKMNI